MISEYTGLRFNTTAVNRQGLNGNVFASLLGKEIMLSVVFYDFCTCLI